MHKTMFKFEDKTYSISGDEADMVAVIVLPDGRPVKPAEWIETYPPQLARVRACTWAEVGDKHFIGAAASEELR